MSSDRANRAALALVPPPRPLPKVAFLSRARDPAVMREEDLARYLRSHPDFTRQEVLHAMVRAGPLRSQLEAELLLLAARKAAQR